MLNQKKFGSIVTFFIIINMMLTACSTEQVTQRVVLDPNDPMAVAVNDATGQTVLPAMSVTLSPETVTAECGEVEGILVREDDVLVICVDPQMFSTMQVGFIAMGSVIAIGEPTPLGEAILGFTIGVEGITYVLVAVGLVTATALTAQNSLGNIVSASVGNGDVYIPTSPDHHVEHNIVAGSAQMVMAQTIVNALTGGNGPDGDKLRCFVMLVGDSIVRVITWSYTHTSTGGVDRGDLVWYHSNSPHNNGGPEWGGAYGNKSGNTLGKVPNDLKDMDGIDVQRENCDDVPPPPAVAG